MLLTNEALYAEALELDKLRVNTNAIMRIEDIATFLAAFAKKYATKSD